MLLFLLCDEVKYYITSDAESCRLCLLNFFSHKSKAKSIILQLILYLNISLQLLHMQNTDVLVGRFIRIKQCMHCELQQSSRQAIAARTEQTFGTES